MSKLKSKPTWRDTEGLYFVHVRLTDEHDNLIPYGGITFCYKFADSTDDKVTVDFAIAICSLADSFNKEYGRQASAGRMFSDRILHFQNGFQCNAAGKLMLPPDTDIAQYLRELGESMFNSVYLDSEDLEGMESEVESISEEESSLH
jgi:hypothetical protein